MHHVKNCQLVLANHPGLAVHFNWHSLPCSNGVFRDAISIGPNRSQEAVRVVLEFSARGHITVAQRRIVLNVSSAPLPPARPSASLSLNPASLSSSGGKVVLTYSSEHASSCSLKSSPTFWPGSNPTTLACNGTYSPKVSSTSSKLQWIFTFTATNAVGVSVSRSRTLTEQAPPATLTGTTVAMEFTSSATAGISTSLVVDYDASLTATCSYSDGSTAPCALPSGTLSWEIDGEDAGGNVTYLSSQLTNCTANVGGSTTESGCDVTWSTYGDQWLTATYSSPSASSIAQTLEVQVTAPVDYGSGLSYSTYGNVGPSAIDDCTMASVADWIETTLGTVPSDQDTIAAYWAAENEFNGGDDVGLTTDELFSYWTDSEIDGTDLTADNPVSIDESDVETDLSDNYVLMASENLPDGDPYGQSGGGHMWIVVGYSDYGPMIVTWGQEIQISWSDFDSWTTGIWGIGVSS
ncbi:MAG: hypothetical protein ABSD85_16950 [Acidimicrobiales bacterium]|jgi:hypothetical protein